MAENKIQFLSDMGIVLQEPPEVTAEFDALEAKAEAMSNEEAWAIHNRLCGKYGWEKFGTLEEFVKECL